jgi:hypothetical protein
MLNTKNMLTVAIFNSYAECQGSLHVKHTIKKIHCKKQEEKERAREKRDREREKVKEKERAKEKERERES